MQFFSDVKLEQLPLLHPLTGSGTVRCVGWLPVEMDLFTNQIRYAEPRLILEPPDNKAKQPLFMFMISQIVIWESSLLGGFASGPRFYCFNGHCGEAASKCFLFKMIIHVLVRCLILMVWCSQQLIIHCMKPCFSSLYLLYSALYFRHLFYIYYALI